MAVVYRKPHLSSFTEGNLHPNQVTAPIIEYMVSKHTAIKNGLIMGLNPKMLLSAG